MRRFLASMRCCLNPKVVGAVLAAAVLVWLVAPGAGAASLPLLLALVCPLSMGVMGWQMRPRRDNAVSAPAAPEPDPIDAELRALRDEIAILRDRRQLAAADGHRSADPAP